MVVAVGSQTEQFLQALFGPASGEYYFHIWTLHDKRALWTNEVQRAVAHTAKSANRDVYAGAALALDKRPSTQRVEVGDVAGLVGLWSDVDYGPGSAKRRPDTAEEALNLVRSIPLQPSIIIHSGHGYQAWWLFDEPWIFDSDGERSEAIILSHRWNVAIRNIASQNGWTVDSVFDLARVMRVPGTMNNKHDERVPVELVDINDLRYSPAEFEPYLPDDPLPEKEEKPVVGIALTLDPQAKLPDEWIYLIHNDPEAMRTFKHEKQIQDPSASGYDLALANMAALLDWPPQQIADLLIAHRRHHGEDLKLREDYYQRTITKAIAWARQQQDEGAARSAADELVYLQSQRASGDATSEDIRPKLRNSVSEALGVNITNVYRYSGDPPEYFLEIAGQKIHIGAVNNLIEQRPLKMIVAAHAGLYLRHWKPHEWRPIAQSLLDMVVPIDVGSDATDVGAIEDWLRSYVDRDIISEDVRAAMTAGDPFIWKGRICVHVGSFVRYMRLSLAINIPQRNVAVRIRTLGGENAQVGYYVNGKSVTRSAWMLPLDKFPPPS